MRPYFALTCVLVCTTLGCNGSPLHPGTEQKADACPEAEPAPEEPPAPRPSWRERVEWGVARFRCAVAAGYARMSEGVESAVDSEAMRTAVKPFLYAWLAIGFFCPR
jgi:hypothetical protein